MVFRAPARRPYAAEGVVVWAAAFVAALFALAFAPPGVTWDEPFYIHYGHAHLNWFRTVGSGGLTRAGIESAWGVGREQPPLFSLAIAVSDAVLGGLPRGATVVEYAFLVSGVFVFVAGRWGRWAGRLAALSMVAMPRVFAHGQLASSDVPMALTWFLAVWAFVRAVERRGAGREVLAGAAFGAALLTKMNACFIPLILAPWALAAYRGRAVRPLLVTWAVGAAVFFAGWPWMWIDTWEHLRGYLGTSTERARLQVYYLGRAWRDIDAPWHYPFVMALATVPVGVIAAAFWGVLGGLGFRAKGLGAGGQGSGSGGPGRAGLTWLLAANVVAPLGLFALPGVPTYDGVRLFLHVFPFVACLAGIGGLEAIRLMARTAERRVHPGSGNGRPRPDSRIVRWVVFALMLLQTVPLFGTLPFGMSYYNVLVGGPWGARRLGFETTYYGDALDQRLLTELKAVVPPRSRVALFPLPAELDYLYYEEVLKGLDLEAVRYRPLSAGPPPYDFLVVVCRQGYFDEGVWALYRGGNAAAGRVVLERRLNYFGAVPLCIVYDLRGQR
jgi:hypothetical protein